MPVTSWLTKRCSHRMLTADGQAGRSAEHLRSLGMRDMAERGAHRTSGTAPFGLDLSMAVFDRATRLARSMFGSAFASIILVQDGEVWRSRYADVLPTEDPLTESVLQGGALLWIGDGRDDPRFAQHP